MKFLRLLRLNIILILLTADDWEAALILKRQIKHGSDKGMDRHRSKEVLKDVPAGV